MPEYAPKDFSRLIGTPGFSEKLLKTHFKLYEGYVKNTNKKLDQATKLAKDDKTDSAQFMELQRRLGWEWNGMRLHEYYFGGMVNGGKELKDGSALADKITDEFRSFNGWKDHFTGIGAMRGIGWAALYYDPQADRLINAWIDEHDTGHLSSCELILVLDVFEHAFIADYGTDKASYMEAFFAAVDWDIVSRRFEAATQGEKVPVTAGR